MNVSDVTEDDERLWLKALIWPEHEERRSLFEGAARQFYGSSFFVFGLFN